MTRLLPTTQICDLKKTLKVVNELNIDSVTVAVTIKHLSYHMHVEV